MIPMLMTFDIATPEMQKSTAGAASPPTISLPVYPVSPWTASVTARNHERQSNDRAGDRQTLFESALLTVVRVTLAS